ncbi:MAG: hypothetical protein QOE58_3061 [Actinomycetota bacterium]|jgi:hypothetical protein|nr:hypothetical protein [Actinomycetota bacterium]
MAATKKVTVTVPAELADELAGHLGKRGGVSAFVSSAVREKLDHDEAVAQLHRLWGDPDPAMVAVAEASLDASSRRSALRSA